MSQIIWQNEFNSITQDLLDWTASLFPDDKTFRENASAFRVWHRAGRNIPASIFANSFMKKHGHTIKERNISYLMDLAASNKAAVTQSSSSVFDISALLDKVDEKEREKIWEKADRLVVLATKLHPDCRPPPITKDKNNKSESVGGKSQKNCSSKSKKKNEDAARL